MIAKVHGRWAFVSHTHKPLAYWHGSGRPTKKWEAEQERRVEMFKHMDAAANPYRSKYKPGDPVVFTHAGPNFQRTATIHTVRKDGALIVHFDDDPPRSILVVQPYEIGPTATTTFRENPVEPWDGPAENPVGPHDLHARIAAVLGWPMKDVQSVSLQSLRDLVRPVSAKLADEISRVVQHAGHYVHTGVETSPTERQILDYLLVDAEDVDRGNFSRTNTEEVATHFKIDPKVAYKRLNALAKRGVLDKTRDIMKKHRGAHAVGWQFWEYNWKPGDEAYADTIRRPAGNPLPIEHTQDEACTVGPDGTCTVCGVSHTGQCACGGRGFHRPGCPEIEAREPMTKPGPNGVLYRCTVSFRDPGKPAFDGEEHWSTWAYSLEHANDLFREEHEGFQIVKMEMQTEAMPAENPNPRPKSHGFIVIATRTGEILSELYKQREGARAAVAAILAEHGRASPAPGDVQYQGGRWYRSLGVHQVMLYPGQTYDRGTYKP